MQDGLYPLEGDSETAQLVRARDWAATPLGPMRDWPQSLRTSLSICLACRFPILLWWGPQMVMLYNDEYIPVLGKKHPASMGGIGREVWSDVWPVVGPMLDSVVGTGRAVKAEDLLLRMNRYGYDEEAYFSFSYSPIVDETGGVGGIFTPVIETTEKVIGPRRTELLRRIGNQPRASSLADACAAFAQVLAGAVEDVPFGMIYQIESDGSARLCASFGLERGAYAAPARIGAAGDDPWQVLQAARSATLQVADGLDRRVAALPPGAWGAPVAQALALPIAMPGQDAASVVLVAAVSPHRALDASYRSFHGLLADQLSGSIGAALSYEAERKRVDALAEIDRAKTAFFSNVSHEFRTPLTLMLGPLEEVSADPAVPEPARAHLRLVQRNGMRLLKLVNALLEFSRIEAGRVVAAFEPVDLAAYTGELAAVFRSAVERAGLRLEVECAALPGPVYADRAMWETIVLNLLSNAFKFTFEGRIAVSLRADGRRALLAVADSGVGIAAADLPKVFERFQRIEGARSRSFEGSGIGLALVRDLVALHGGEVAIASTPGQGTTVTVAIPFGTAHLPPAQVAGQAGPAQPAGQAQAWMAEAELWLGNAAAAPGAPVHPGPAPLAYVVDDNADMASYVAALLAPRHAVRTFADGSEALAAARRQRPDVIVSDVMMPVMNGYQLLAALKAEPALCTVPVLLLSARAGEEARISAAQAGSEFYLEKPFSGRELQAKVDALLLRARIREVEAASSQRMAAIFAQAPCAIAMLRGPEHVYELANPPYLALIGQRDVLHQPIRQALPELEGQGVFELLDEVLRSGKPYVGRALRIDVLRGSPATLQEAYFDCVYQPTLDAEGKPDGIAVVAFEVTETVQARRAADEASLAKDEFMAMLGHELRNPLAPIMTALEVMKLRGIDNVQREHGIIQRQARHLVELVNDLLDVARVSRGKVELRRAPAELAAVVAAAVETVGPLLEEREQALRVEVPEQGLGLWVDFARMSQVFANLLTNAAKYSEKGSPILVRGRREGDDVVLEVADRGHGIGPDLLPRVFDMFYQDPQSLSRSRGGLGLGLTIVRSLTELHGGSVSVDSEGVGKGATFTVRIPAAAPATAQAAGAVPARAARGPAASLPSILVVDDNVDGAQMLSALLGEHGYAVDTAFDGPSALRRLDEGRRDLAILDIGLPGMDGYELAHRIRHAHGDAIRLVALTGYGQDSDRLRALEAGFDLHVAKPVNHAALNEMIAALMARAPRVAGGALPS